MAKEIKKTYKYIKYIFGLVLLSSFFNQIFNEFYKRGNEDYTKNDLGNIDKVYSSGILDIQKAYAEFPSDGCSDDGCGSSGCCDDGSSCS